MRNHDSCTNARTRTAYTLACISGPWPMQYRGANPLLANQFDTELVRYLRTRSNLYWSLIVVDGERSPRCRSRWRGNLPRLSVSRLTDVDSGRGLVHVGTISVEGKSTSLLFQTSSTASAAVPVRFSLFRGIIKVWEKRAFMGEFEVKKRAFSTQVAGV